MQRAPSASSRSCRHKVDYARLGRPAPLAVPPRHRHSRHSSTTSLGDGKPTGPRREQRHRTGAVRPSLDHQSRHCPRRLELRRDEKPSLGAEPLKGGCGPLWEVWEYADEALATLQ